MGDKPTAAFVLSLIGGVFVLLGAIVYFFVGSFFAVLLSMMAIDALYKLITTYLDKEQR